MPLSARNGHMKKAELYTLESLTMKILWMKKYTSIFSTFQIRKQTVSLPCWEEQQVQVNGFINLSIFKNLPKKKEKRTTLVYEKFRKYKAVYWKCNELYLSNKPSGTIKDSRNNVLSVNLMNWRIGFMPHLCILFFLLDNHCISI